MKVYPFLFKKACFFLLLLQLSSCSDHPSVIIITDGKTEKVATGEWTGKLVAGYASDLRYYDFNTKKENTVYRQAGQPFVTRSGDILYVTGKFPKAGKAIQVADPAFNNNTVLLDLTDMFGGNLFSPRLSPDGNKLAVTVTSWSGYKIDGDAVLVFNKGGAQIARFPNKYNADWTPDGRLVMAGTLKSESVDGSVRTKETPGIFISDATLASLTRVDPKLDDPAPYHPAVSPDGKRIAFVRNDHIWIMNLDGSNLKQITAAAGDDIETFPAWSPDGKNIACWVYKTFERSYFTAIAVVPADAEKATPVANDAPIWPRDPEGNRISGGGMQFSWIN